MSKVNLHSLFKKDTDKRKWYSFKQVFLEPTVSIAWIELMLLRLKYLLGLLRKYLQEYGNNQRLMDKSMKEVMEVSDKTALSKITQNLDQYLPVDLKVRYLINWKIYGLRMEIILASNILEPKVIFLVWQNRVDKESEVNLNNGQLGWRDIIKLL